MLDDGQIRAVNAPPGYVLVRAPAGSGKTRVLTGRIVHMIRDLGISPDQILAVTFTNCAANEMISRLGEILENPPEAVGTLHAFASEVVRRDLGRLGIDRDHNFGVLDEDGQRSLIFKAMSLVRRDRSPSLSSPYSLADMLTRWKFGKFLGIEFLSEIELARNGEFFAQYEGLLESRNLLDFDDLLIHACTLLGNFVDVAQYWRGRYRYILVDEYQDLNEVQYRIINSLIGDNFFAVGDPNQCIYLFNGAKEGIFGEFKGLFTGTMEFCLNRNYRSGRGIVELSNRVSHSHFVDVIAEVKVPGEVRFFEEFDEQIFREFRDGPMGNWAILFPRHIDVKGLIVEFIGRGIDFRVPNFFLLRNRDVARVINYLRAIYFDGPSPLRKILDGDHRLGEHDRRELLLGYRPDSLSSFLFTSEGWRNLPIGQRGIGNIGLLVDELRYFRSRPRDDLVALSTELAGKLTDMGDQVRLLIRWLGNLQKIYKNAEDAVKNISNYSYFQTVEPGTPRDYMLFSSIHRAKGLEWDNVIVLEYDSLEREFLDGLQNRNLLYVAVTRARKRLFLIRN